MRQINRYDSRYYFDESTGKIYASATTFCKAVLPTSKHLIEWRVKYGHYESLRMAQEAADYGTLMHELIEMFLGERMITIRKMKDYVFHYCETKGYLDKPWHWFKEIKSDLLAFAQFAYDKRLDPIALEQWVWKDITDQGGVAGTVDFHGYADFNGKQREVIIDWKSGRKGFWESHELQLQLYKHILDVEMCFNWSPKNWRSATPTYNFKNQTKSPMADKLEYYLQIAIVDNFFTVNITDTDFTEIKLGEAPTFVVKDIHEILQDEKDSQ